MKKTFSKKYSQYYDIMYSEKPYEKECEYLEKIFNIFSKKKIKKILDLGCGTGNHAIILAKKSYNVVGIDKSKYMLQIAVKKALKEKLNIKFIQSNIINFKLNEKFDACIAMFAVINYIIKNKNILKCFKNINFHLEKNGLFIFDFWYGPAVIHIKPSIRYLIKEKNDIKIVRIADPIFIPEKQINITRYFCYIIKNKKVIDEFTETHKVKYFFPDELNLLLSLTGFKVEKFLEFLKIDKEPNINTWNAICIAKKIKNE